MRDLIAAAMAKAIENGATKEELKSFSDLMEENLPIISKEQSKENVAIGQRKVNLIWENTQMKIALSVIWISLIVSAALAVLGKWLGTPDLQLAAVVFVFGVANLVTGFYFGRTNHQKIGGVTGTDEISGR